MNEIDEVSKTYHRNVVVQEHVSLIEELDNHYISHDSPESTSASAICDAILEKLSTIDSPFDRLHAIGCDGTNVNTG